MNNATGLKKVDDVMREELSEPMTYSTEAYLSEAYVRAERDKLWRKVWLQAGRVEEIPEVGNYITYDVSDDSILIVRTAADEIRAYHNVCQHRGRRLVDTPKGANSASGKTKHFVCGFHGWRWNLDGENAYVPDKDDWNGCLTTGNTRLKRVNLDTWGGWIWINMDPDCEPLRDWLEPAATLLNPFELQNMRFKWRRWAVFDCNWKVALEAFIESYHVAATHPEFTKFGSYSGWAKVAGKHCVTGYDAAGQNSTRLRLGTYGDPRVTTAELVTYVLKEANTNFTQTVVNAALRLVDELPEGTPADKVLKHWLDSARRDDAARGVIWPTIDPADVVKAGKSWSIFPNFRIGHGLNNALCYQGRPHGHDPDKCIFEITALELYPKGQEPRAAWEHVLPEDEASWGRALPQDFRNMAAVQQGMKSLGFSGPRPNPKEERAVTALHQVLSEYMGTGAPRALK